MIDGKIDASERRKLKTLLQERFELEGEKVRSLLVEAVVREHESVDLTASPACYAASLTRTDANVSLRCCGK